MTAPSDWRRNALIYQIYPRSFMDASGDGVGDLAGCIDKLDYITSLGVDAVWLSPFFTSPMADFGYDVADYCDVDPLFGTLDDFDAFLEGAHRRNLKVIIDQVYSHTSEQHAWFSQSRSDRVNARADWYVWADARPDGSPPNNWQSVFGGPAWEWDARRRQYYLHNFLKEQPDLNLHNEDVQDALLNVARFWLDRGVDGFRLDAINFAMHDPDLKDNPPSGIALEKVTRPYDMQAHLYNRSQDAIPTFLARLRDVLDEYDDRFSVAEVVGDDSLAEMKAFTADDRHLHAAYNFDFLYADNLSPESVKRTLSNWSGGKGEGAPAWAFSNHDAPRAVSRWAPPDDRKAAAELYLMLLFSFKGCAFLYQGEELGLPQGVVPFERLQDPEAIANWPRTLGRDGACTPMPWRHDAPNCGFSPVEPWLASQDRHAPLAVDAQETDDGSTLAFTRQLAVLRSQSPAIRDGDMAFLQAPDPVLVFERRSESETLLCVYNLGPETVRWRPDNVEGELLACRSGTIWSEVPDQLAAHEGYWLRR